MPRASNNFCYIREVFMIPQEDNRSRWASDTLNRLHRPSAPTRSWHHPHRSPSRRALTIVQHDHRVVVCPAQIVGAVVLFPAGPTPSRPIGAIACASA